MAKASATSKIHIKLFAENSIMVSWKDKENSILQRAITMLVSSDSIRSKVEEFTLGLEKKAMFIKDSSKQGKGMVEVLFGGQTVAGMKEISEMEFKVDGECSTDKEDIANTKVIGTTVCSMVKVLSTSKTDNGMKAHSSKTSFMEKECFIKTTQLFTEFGRTMSCPW